MKKTIWLNKHITVNPDVRFGKPCIRGTRLAVEDILNMLAAGWTVEEIIKDYRGLTKKDLQAALDFARTTTHLVRDLANAGLVRAVR